MRYTPNRGYPYPKDEKETGNGGLHSELLARAVAADLDTLDAGWAAELGHSTVLLKLNGDKTGFIANDANQGVFFDDVDHASTGPFLFSGAGSQVIAVNRGGDGWYHCNGSLRALPSGTVNDGARHRLGIVVFEFVLSQGTIVDARYAETYMNSTQDITMTVDGMFYLRFGQTLEMRYLHANTSSDMTVRAAGTHLAATRIMGA